MGCGGEMAASVAVEGCLRLRLYLRQCRTKQVVWCCGADWDGWVDGWVSTSMQAVSFVLGCLSCLWVICIRGCLCCDMSWQCFTSSSYVHIHTFICHTECFTLQCHWDLMQQDTCHHHMVWDDSLLPTEPTQHLSASIAITPCTPLEINILC